MNLQPTTYNRQLQTQKILAVFPPRLQLSVVSSWLLVVGSWSLPILASAQTQTIEIFTATDENLNFTTLADKLAEIANAIIPFLIGVAFVAIIWGILKYVRSAGDTEKVAEGRKVIIYGIIALFLMLSFWGFVMMIKNSLF